jgi:hypothetical protein
MSELINTLDTPGEFDALRMLRPDEPYFLLLARDRLAPPLAQQWADDNRARALREFSEGTIDEERRDRELRKSTEAEAIGWTMQAYKAGDMAKRVQGKPTAKAYTGFELTEEQRHRDAMQSAAARAVAALNSAWAELSELSRLTVDPEHQERKWALENEVQHLKALVEAVRPATVLKQYYRQQP